MKDTIAAVSTAYGKGGIAVIRISGEEAISVADKVFCTASKVKISDIDSNRCVFGYIMKRGIRIDDGMCTVFRAPHSYTGEDIVEISCHGGILLTEKVLESVFEAGARQASAGEFTKRAFINGKLSLSQAEAVGMLIDADNNEALALASSHKNGVIKQKSDELYEKLKTVVTGIYANIDFPDEDLAEYSDDEVLSEILFISSELKELQNSYHVGKAICEGISTVIVGKPNTGKSSLLNRLIGSDRAIVTDIPGTTRDTVEEKVHCGRIMLKLCDTAGIRETTDAVERIGVDRTLATIESAELILAVFDSSSHIDDLDENVIEKIRLSRAIKIAILNKNDLKQVIGMDDLKKYNVFSNYISISAGNKDRTSDIDKLREIICSYYISGDLDYSSRAVLSNARQNAAVTRAIQCLDSAVKGLRGGNPSDTVGFDLESALSELSELDGRKITEEIVDDIFHRFCVGK